VSLMMGVRLSFGGGARFGRRASRMGRPPSIPQGRGLSGATPSGCVEFCSAPPSSPRKGEYVAVKSRNGQPNKRLKLPAPGLGRIAFVPQRTVVNNSITAAPASAGRRSLSAIR
jgi:hypothetical protein